MISNRIATTPKHRMHALAYQGMLASDCCAQIRDVLRSRLGEDYALLFAEPVTNPADNSIDWYSPVQGTAIPIAHLPEEKKQTTLASLAAMAADIRVVAEELKASETPAHVTRGHMLELALRTPDDQSLYVVGQHAVITCWGFGPGTPGAEPQDLTRLASRAPQQPPLQAHTDEPHGTPAPAPAAVRSGFGGLWWLLPMLLLLGLLVLLTTSFGGHPSLAGCSFFNAPALPVDASNEANKALQKLDEQTSTLAQSVDALRERLKRHVDQCVTPPPAVSVPAPVQPQVKHPNELVLPDKPEDVAFMNGRWLCEAGLINEKTRQPIVVEYTFDTQGKGQVIVTESPAEKCRGAATASLTTEGHLQLDVDKQVCTSGKSYRPEIIVCQNVHGEALCRGKSVSGQDWGGQVKFIRLP